MVGLFIFVGVFLCAMGFALLQVTWLGLQVRFLRFKLEQHPALIKMIDDVLLRITTEQNLPVFYKTYEELNKGRGGTEEKKEALGMYVYTRDPEHQKNCDNTLRKIRELEKKYRKSYRDICKFAGEETNVQEDSFVLPKILLCHEEAQKFGLLAFYSTYFHEIGHHYAITLNNDESEEAADRIAREMVRTNLPYFFTILPFIDYRYKLEDEPTIKVRLKAYWDYYRNYKHLKIKQNDIPKQ
jgi:hypothetical protein